MLKYTGSVTLGLLLILAASAAAATPVTYRYVARVTDVAQGRAVDFGGLVNVGDIFTGVIAWDTETPLLEVTSSNFHVYRAPVPIHQWTVDDFGLGARVGDTSTPASWSVTSSFAGSSSTGQHAFAATHPSVFDGGASAQPFDVPYDRFYTMFSLWDVDAEVFAAPSLPAALDLSDFERREMRMFSSGFPATDWAIETEIVSLVPIPEPSSALLVMLGLLALASTRERDSAD